jgi:hypothetical protein
MTKLFSNKYVPHSLTRKDKKKQTNMLRKSRRMYKKHKYYTRKQIPSYKSKTSNHITLAKHIYGVNKISPSKLLATKTGCSVQALRKIVNKGAGAYYSSGSRPNQTPQSWGLARLASAITAGKASKIDYDIIDKGCNHKKTAYVLATKKK